ncbi:Hypothetical predicted protein [Mytilus galloprovincialis]|uniref:Uncharacterized protein n=1 Tax=Mytilus galloprovincialis TaxID=29158 RepID=A0A8B6DCL1_MYTGA|nr:Hypothetical predicted protein [Mytilus galloprovincialis]
MSRLVTFVQEINCMTKQDVRLEITIGLTRCQTCNVCTGNKLYGLTRCQTCNVCTGNKLYGLTRCQTVTFSGKMVVERGSVEWSDDDAVKSGSNTEGDVADDQPPERKGHKKNFKTPITTLNMKSDPISTILHKIDAEISSLSRSQSSAGTASTVIHRPSSRSRSPHRPDDELTRSQLDRPGPMRATHKYNDSYSGSSRGRESPLVNGDIKINGDIRVNGDSRINGDTRHNGVADMYNDMANDRFFMLPNVKYVRPEESKSIH